MHLMHNDVDWPSRIAKMFEAGLFIGLVILNQIRTSKVAVFKQFYSHDFQVTSSCSRSIMHRNINFEVLYICLKLVNLTNYWPYSICIFLYEFRSSKTLFSYTCTENSTICDKNNL